MQPKTWSPNLSEKNGFAMAQEIPFRDIQVSSSEIGVRTIALNDLWQSLKEGYDDFNATPAVGKRRRNNTWGHFASPVSMHSPSVKKSSSRLMFTSLR